MYPCIVCPLTRIYSPCFMELSFKSDSKIAISPCSSGGWQAAYFNLDRSWRAKAGKSKCHEVFTDIQLFFLQKCPLGPCK